MPTPPPACAPSARSAACWVAAVRCRWVRMRCSKAAGWCSLALWRIRTAAASSTTVPRAVRQIPRPLARSLQTSCWRRARARFSTTCRHDRAAGRAYGAGDASCPAGCRIGTGNPGSGRGGVRVSRARHRGGVAGCAGRAAGAAASRRYRNLRQPQRRAIRHGGDSGGRRLGAIDRNFCGGAGYRACVAGAGYQWRQQPHADAAPLLACWRAGGIDAVTVTSAETLHNLAALLGETAVPLLLRTPLFVPHEKIADAARRFGVARVIATQGGDAGLVDGLINWFRNNP